MRTSRPPIDLSVEEALAQFLLQLEADGRSDHTLAQYRRHVLSLARWLRSRGHSGSIGGIDTQDLARFLTAPETRTRPDGEPKRQTSLNALRSSLRVFFGYLQAAGELSQNPARLIRRALCESRGSRALDDAEVERLLAVLDQARTPEERRDRVLFRLMLGTGIRIGSALRLRGSDVDLYRRELLVRRAKGGRELRVNLPLHLGPLLVEAASVQDGSLFPGRGGRAMTVRHATRRFSSWLEKAQIVRVTGSHVLRHTFAVSLYRATRDILLVKDSLGHRSLHSTLTYARAAPRPNDLS